MTDIPEDDRIGRQIADAAKALEPEQVAAVIVKSIFEADGSRMPGHMRYVAIKTIGGALGEWRKQLLASDSHELEKFKQAYAETKNELENLKLHLAILQKEGKLG